MYWWELHKNTTSSWANPGNNTPQNNSCTATRLPSQKPSKLDEHVMQDFYGRLHMDVQVLAHQQQLIYISSLRIHDLV